MWQPPAAKEGQGDCEFPLLPPWILGYPFVPPPLRYGDGGGGAGRSGVAHGLGANDVCRALRSAVVYSIIAALLRYCLLSNLPRGRAFSQMQLKNDALQSAM